MAHISGMIRAMAAVPRVHLADPQANVREIVELLRQADAQNVRLCSKLIGWNITIQNEEPKDEKGSIRDQLRQAAARLAADLDISEKTANLLISNGYVTVDGVKEAGRDTLLELEGVDAEEINHAFEHLDA